MLNFALRMNDSSFIAYIMYCAKLGIAPGNFKSLEKFMTEKS